MEWDKQMRIELQKRIEKEMGEQYIETDMNAVGLHWRRIGQWRISVF
jgi:hypothetical protein